MLVGGWKVVYRADTRPPSIAIAWQKAWGKVRRRGERGPWRVGTRVTRRCPAGGTRIRRDRTRPRYRVLPTFVRQDDRLRRRGVLARHHSTIPAPREPVQPHVGKQLWA